MVWRLVWYKIMCAKLLSLWELFLTGKTFSLLKIEGIESWTNKATYHLPTPPNILVNHRSQVHFPLFRAIQDSNILWLCVCVWCVCVCVRERERGEREEKRKKARRLVILFWNSGKHVQRGSQDLTRTQAALIWWCAILNSSLLGGWQLWLLSFITIVFFMHKSSLCPYLLFPFCVWAEK